MATTASNGSLREALTFDDVLLKPGLSDVLPTDTDVRTRITREIALNIPIITSAMDTVTEATMAIAMAQAGGLGVIHRNLDPEQQAALVRQVKKFESGMVVNPLTIDPDSTLADALTLMKQNGISGIPVVEGNGARNPGKLVGILTNRDVRFATDPDQKVSELMTKEHLVTVRESVSQQEAKRLLHQHRIEKLLVVDDKYRCVGLITVKDIEKAVAHPSACKDEQGRLRVAAATTVGDKGFARTEQLIAAGVDLVVVDTAHGHSKLVLAAVDRIKRLSNAVQVVAGNVATSEGAKALIDAGADAIKVGIGPGSICTTRIVAGVGVPQLTAILDAVEVAHKTDTPVIADGGIKYSGDLAKAIAAGAECGDDRLAAGRHRRDPGRGLSLSGPLLQDLSRHGLGRRHGARLGRSLLPAGHQGLAQAGAGGRRRPGALQGAGRERAAPAGRRAARRHGLCRRKDASRTSMPRPSSCASSGAGMRESHVHDVTHTRESPNYPSGTERMFHDELEAGRCPGITS